MQATEKVWGEPIATAFQVDHGQEIGFALPIQGRGTLTKVMVVQLAGALEGFSYTIYNKRAACPPGANPSSAATVAEQLYRVVGPITVASNKSYFDGNGETWPNTGVYGVFIPYHNMDLDQSTNYTDSLYIKISSAGSDVAAKKYGVALTTCQWTF